MKELARQLAFVLLFLTANGLSRAAESSLPPDYSIPVIDLSKDANRQVIVDKEPGPAAYSCLAAPPDNSIACLYKAGKITHTKLSPSPVLLLTGRPREKKMHVT